MSSRPSTRDPCTLHARGNRLAKYFHTLEQYKSTGCSRDVVDFGGTLSIHSFIIHLEQACFSLATPGIEREHATTYDIDA